MQRGCSQQFACSEHPGIAPACGTAVACAKPVEDACADKMPLIELQTEGSEAKKELAPEYVENQKSVDCALLGSLSDDLKVLRPLYLSSFKYLPLAKWCPALMGRPKWSQPACRSHSSAGEAMFYGWRVLLQCFRRTV